MSVLSNSFLGDIEIENQSFQVYNVPGDGNCFFHCLSILFAGDLSNTAIYRNLVCGRIFGNWENWQHKVSVCHGSLMTPEMYFDGMINGNWWATACEIEAASDLFDSKINVWLVGKNKDQNTTFTLTTYTPASNSATNVHLLLMNEHFMVLKNTYCAIPEYENNIPADKNNSETNANHHGDTFDETDVSFVVEHDHGYAFNQHSNYISSDHCYSMQGTSNESIDSVHTCTSHELDEQEIYYAVPISHDSTKTRVKNTKKSDPQAKKRKIAQPSIQTGIDQKSDFISNPTDPQIDICRKLGVWYKPPSENETAYERKQRKSFINRHIKKVENQIGLESKDVPDAPPSTDNMQFNKAMDSIRAFELEQMSYQIHTCSVCKESKIDMKLDKNSVCKRCSSEKADIKMFSEENFMNPGLMPNELKEMSVVEQQLISRISPCMNIHMLRHGGIASSGHCVTFPQEVNEPAQIFPRLPNEIQIIKVRKQGKNDSSKEFRVRRLKIECALNWLKDNNPAYKDIIISQERLEALPLDGELDAIPTAEYTGDAHHITDKGPAPNQTEISDIEQCNSTSAVLFPDDSVNIKEQVETVVKEIVGDNANVTQNKQGTITIPWPTRGNLPLSEFTTEHFFSLAFPCLFPYGVGDFHINRPITCKSLSDWAEHLIWFKDGRFARHQYFKFVVHNMIVRKQTLEKGSFIVNQKLGETHMTVTELKDKLQNGDQSIAQKILYFSNTLRGTTQYWAQRNKELRALNQFKINNGDGLPSFFTTGSCAEFHFKPLRRLLSIYIEQCTGEKVNFDNHVELFHALQQNSHIVAKYFDLRTQSYFEKVMGPVFGVNTYWYRQEFAKSRGMVHWHGLCWRHDREPHNLLYECVKAGLSDSDCAQTLSDWAKYQFGLSAKHPAGVDEKGNPRKNLWPPPEGSAPQPPEEKNPLVKLLMDVSSSQESILEDYLLLTNRFNLHRCSDYCLKPNKHKPALKQCRMEFGTESNPGKPLRAMPDIIKDKNSSLRLEMERDHPMLVQNSQYHTQGWRANGDISLILSKSPPENPSVNEIIATERYITGYACKGNETSESLSDLFSDMINCATDESSNNAKSLCNKFLMKTVKRDISAVEASYELSRLPLYRSSHTFKSISLSGFRVLEKNGTIVTKSTALDQYLSRDAKDKSSFYSYVCKTNTVPVFSGNTQATWPLHEEYCKIMLVLHWPNWRKFLDIKPESSSWKEAFEMFLSSDSCPNFVKAGVERAQQHKQQFDDQSDVEDNSVNRSSQQPEWMDILKPDADYDVIPENLKFDDGGEDYNWGLPSEQYPNTLGQTFLENLNVTNDSDDGFLDLPNVDLFSMNADQLLAFNIVMNTLQHFNDSYASYQPLRLVVSGTAGSGKSHLIKCIVKAVRLFLNSNRSVQVVCPTGNSANLIGGVTLHSYLKVPTSHAGKEMSSPQGATADSLQSNLQGLKVLLVDERSLVGVTTLGWMEFMCRYGIDKGQHCNMSWGGLPVVVFFGDDVQLPPVLDSPVYNNSRKTTPAALHGVMVWQEFSNSVALNTIIRQNSDENQLNEVLLSLREYKTTPDHTTWLQNFQWNNLKSAYGAAALKDMQNRGLFVFPTHAEVWEHNKTMLTELNKTYPVAQIKGVSKGCHASSVTKDKAGGLVHTLYLSKTAKVMLTVNLSVKDGLFNGALGTVVDILYMNGRRPPDTFPDVIMVNFPSYTGPPFLIDNPKLVPIVPVERRIDCLCHSCKRRQIPLCLGWATTIHKCQGMTIGEGETNRYIVINPGTRKFESQNPGALFVALSRAKSAGSKTKLPDFAWHPSVLVNQDRICHVVNTPTTTARDREIQRLVDLSRHTLKQFQHLSHDLSICNKINAIFANFSKGILEE